MAENFRIVPLQKSHHRQDFCCGEPSLDEFIQRFALQNQRIDNSRTFACLTEQARVIGFYSLSVGSVSHQNATSYVAKKQPRYPIPIILLGRLAVDQEFKGKGLGATLLRDALLRSASVSDQAGVVAVVVDALHEQAKSFYQNFGFECSPTNPMRLMVTIKSIRRFLM